MTTPPNKTILDVSVHVDNAGGQGQVATGHVTVDAFAQAVVPISCANATNFVNVAGDWVNWLMNNGIATTVWFNGSPTTFTIASLRNSAGTSAVLDFLTTIYIAFQKQANYVTFTNGDIPTIRLGITAETTDVNAVAGGLTNGFLAQFFLGIGAYNPTYVYINEDTLGFATCLSSVTPVITCPADVNSDGVITYAEYVDPLNFRMALLPGSKIGDSWTMNLAGTDINGIATVTGVTGGTLASADITNGYVTLSVNVLLVSTNQTLTVTGLFSRGNNGTLHTPNGILIIQLEANAVLAAPVITFPQDVDGDNRITVAEYAAPTLVNISIPPHASVGDTWQLNNNVSQVSSGTLTNADITRGYVQVQLTITPNVITAQIIPV